MADQTVTVEEFAAVLAEFAKFGLDEKKQAVHDGMKKIAREAKQEVESKSRVSDKITDSYVAEVDKALARVGGESKVTARNRHYKDSWTTSTTEENGVLITTVHNKKWQLVHLLEYGHLTRKGTGRTAGTGKERTKAYKHVEPVQTHVEEKVNALLEGL